MMMMMMVQLLRSLIQTEMFILVETDQLEMQQYGESQIYNKHVI